MMTLKGEKLTGMAMVLGLLKDDGIREDGQKNGNKKTRSWSLSLERPLATKMMGPAPTYLLTTNQRCPDYSRKMCVMWEETQEETVATAAMGNNFNNDLPCKS